MRVAVVYFSNKKRRKLSVLAGALADGIRSQGHQVDVIDGDLDVNSKLTVYNYVAVGTESLNFLGGKIPSRAGFFLSNSGLIRGKRSYAFLLRSILRPLKSLNKLMYTMEHEGMYLKKSDVISSTEEASMIGKNLHIS